MANGVSGFEQWVKDKFKTLEGWYSSVMADYARMHDFRREVNDKFNGRDRKDRGIFGELSDIETVLSRHDNWLKDLTGKDKVLEQTISALHGRVDELAASATQKEIDDRKTFKAEATRSLTIRQWATIIGGWALGLFALIKDLF